MLLTQNLFFSPPVESSLTNCSHKKTRVDLFLGSFEKKNSRSRSCGELRAHHNGYTYFTTPHHPLESELPLFHETESGPDPIGIGIGIDEFYDGKNIFLTGATGLLGKALGYNFLYQTAAPTKLELDPFLGSFEKKNSRSRNCGELSVHHNGNTYFTTPQHPLESELPLFKTESGSDPVGIGIGIDKFYDGKNIFLTGATGLLGKALVEKLLRSTSVGKIYILMKANDREATLNRFSKEIIDSKLFECLREKHGSSYEEFVRSKVIPVVGDICAPNIGMDLNSANDIMKDVDVIIESAASTTLNDRYDFMLDINVNAPVRLMRFAKRCKNLKLFVHISTAYVNGIREGIIYEEPLMVGGNGRENDDENEKHSSLFPLDLTDEMNLAMKACIASTNYDESKSKELKRLGLERAAQYGWYNAYQMTKAMGEMVLNEIRQDVPLLILRPSIIESCYKEPVPGWIQGNRMYDPVIISYGKGQLPAYLADPNLHTDIIPLDMVVNTIIAAVAKDGISSKPQLNVYHVATDYMNPLRFRDMFDYFYEHFSADPLPEWEGVTQMKFFNNFSDFSNYVRGEKSEICGVGNENGMSIQKVQRQRRARVAYAEQLCKMYEFIGLFKARFHTGNTRKLLGEMSTEERATFEIDVTKIDWRKYFVQVHIPGLKKYVLNGARSTKNV